MFSFGIFTTHIPYIAFVAFYAYFLLFGIERASKGELQSEKSSFIAELQIESYVSVNDQQNKYFQDENNYFNQAGFEPFIFKRKVRPPVNPSMSIRQTELYSPLSNRPPPVIG